jgi:hypothetical protein
MTTPTPDRDKPATRSSDHEARIVALEDDARGRAEDHKMLREVHAAIVGTMTHAGMAEEIRHLKARVEALERGRNILTGIAVTAATAVASAWAAFSAGPKPPAHP